MRPFSRHSRGPVAAPATLAAQIAALPTALLTALLAACGDGASAPTAPIAPARPSMLQPSGEPTPTFPATTPDSALLTVHLSYDASVLTGAERPIDPGAVLVTTSGFTRSVTDNAAGDLDARSAYVRVRVPRSAAVKVSLGAADGRFTLAGAVTNLTWSGGGMSATLRVQRRPVFRVAFGYLDLTNPWDPALAIVVGAGGEVKVSGPNGFSKVIADYTPAPYAGYHPTYSNSVYNVGLSRFHVLGEPGQYTICATRAPVGYKIAPTDQCQTRMVNSHGSVIRETVIFTPLSR